MPEPQTPERGSRGSARILIVAAMRSEVAGIIGKAEVCLTGVGVHQARRKLRARLEQGPRPELIVSAGLSGALTEDLAAGDLVVATEVVFGDVEYQTERPEDLRAARARLGRICCATRTVSTRNERLAIAERTGALCVDMESGAVAEVAAEFGIPMAAIRAVMDGVDDVIADFDSPRDEAERDQIRALIKTDMKTTLGEKAHVAIERLEEGLCLLLSLC